MPLIVSSNRYWDVTWNEIKICHIVSWTINLSSCHHNNLSELREKVKCYKNDFIVDSDEYVLCGLQCKKLDWCQHKWIKIIIVCVIYLVLSLFGNISCRSNRNHQSLKHNMIPAKTHAKGLTVEIERDVWTSKYRTRVTRSAAAAGSVITTLQWGNCRPCYTRKCCMAWHCSECEDGSSPARWHRGQLNRLPSKHQCVMKCRQQTYLWFWEVWKENWAITCKITLWNKKMDMFECLNTSK